MPEQIHMKTGTCTESPIKVDRPGVKFMIGDNVKFINQLDGGNAAPTAEVRFYNFGAKPVDEGDLGNPISGFCQEEPGSYLPVPASGTPPTCTPLSTGPYAYTIKATGHQTLDPVLIIEESIDFEIGPPTISIPVFAIGLVVAIVLGYLAGRYFR